MLNSENQVLDISQIEEFALTFSKKLQIGDIVLLKGELGSGKTTISRFIINHLYSLNNLKRPLAISSPSYPILLTYELGSFDIYHYDLFRIKDIKELFDLDFLENINNSISLIEWPEILLNSSFQQKYYFLELQIKSDLKRIINIKYYE